MATVGVKGLMKRSIRRRHPAFWFDVCSDCNVL